MKTVTKIIKADREIVALSDNKKSGFPVAFGDRELFDILQIEIVRESCNKTEIYQIAADSLPNNKTNTTRFYLKESDNGVVIRWCSKVAANVNKIK